MTKRTLGPLFRLQPGGVVAPRGYHRASRWYLAGLFTTTILGNTLPPITSLTTLGAKSFGKLTFPIKRTCENVLAIPVKALVNNQRARLTALVFVLGAVILPISPQEASDVFTPEKTVGFSASSIYPEFVIGTPSQSQKSTEVTTREQTEMANRVRQEFLHAWNGYKQYAWGHDELKPLSKSYRDWYGASLYVTPVDALDTMILMGLDDEAAKTREFIAKNLSFDQDISVKNFEVSIRMLGGLLSSYQLTDDKRLLALAEDLGKRLLPVFNSPTGMPYVNVNLKTGAVSGEETNPAEVGTLLIEFGTLSKLVGKPIYYDKAKHALVELYNRRDETSHIGGGIDSYYEYLLKGSLLFDDKDCERMWKSSVKAVNQYLANDAVSGFWYGQANMNSGKHVGTYFGALDAFFPGELALSGDLDRAKSLEESCYRMWTKWGIEPEVLNYSNMKIVENGYTLRPEIIESAYYLYHFTKDRRYLD
jgi:mannosidase alpha-like ER degradation enhancer 2